MSGCLARYFSHAAAGSGGRVDTNDEGMDLGVFGRQASKAFRSSMYIYWLLRMFTELREVSPVGAR